MGRENDMTAWRLFAEAARCGSVTAACEKLNEDPSAASRMLRALERDLGVELFDRSTRPAGLTEMGEKALKGVERLLSEHERLVTQLTTAEDSLEGTIRVAIYGGVAAIQITPLMVQFQQSFPYVDFEMHELAASPLKGFETTSGRRADVVLTYSMGEIEGVKGWHVGNMPFIACASPNYIRRFGSPKTPEECKDHICLSSNAWQGKPSEFLLKDGRKEPLSWKRTLFFHQVMHAKQALDLGAGIAVDISAFHTIGDIEAGRLVPVLDGWHVPTRACSTYVPEEALRYKRVRHFLEWLTRRQREEIAYLQQRVEAVARGKKSSFPSLTVSEPSI